MTILAIYGASRTGKTTLARAVADACSVSFRSCGDEIRGIASQSGIAPKDWTDEQHRAVDQATVDWAQQVGDAVVEGHFLHYVLHSLQSTTILMRLLAPELTRARRMPASTGGLEQIAASDEVDALLVSRLYSGISPLPPNLILDTATSSIEECLSQATKLWQTSKSRRG